MSLKSVQHLSKIKIHDEWETPPRIYEQACETFGFWPSLDVCATSKTNKCGPFYSQYEDDADIDHECIGINALYYEWDLDFFMNPPYSKIKTWMQKAYEQHIKHNVNVLILCYAKTDTKWWHQYVEGKAEIHFIKGRIKFYQNGIPSKQSAPYPSCWIIYRKKN